MITPQNYLLKTNDSEVRLMPPVLQKGHEFFLKVTSNGTDLNSYNSGAAVKNAIGIYFDRLNKYLDSNKTANKKPENSSARKSGGESHVKPYSPRSNSKPRAAEEVPVTLVERIPEELRFIKRFINLNGKTKTQEEILRFINSLQKSILEKRIRKTSKYADQVRLVQEKLIEVYNSMKARVKFELKSETYESLKALTIQEKVLPSINFIKRYIAMNGKAGMKEKARQLLTQINRALDKGRITDNDPYNTEIDEIKRNLKSFTGNKAHKVLEIEKTALNGLEGILGCTCQSLNGSAMPPEIMNSMDFVKLKFERLGFTGKWLELIGDPSPNFTAMVFGLPKLGKTTLCLEFANYLSQNHGRVLYVSKEEGLYRTLQDKVKRMGLNHPNLTVASIMDDFNKYDFIFLDSVNRLGLTPEDLQRMREQYPNKAFIFIFQTTKDGKFRGANTFQHDVDIVIEVPELGRAVQMGRFNQGGELQILQYEN